MVKIGWKAGAEQFTPTDLLEAAEQAEQKGFDFLDISDHFHPWSEEGQAVFCWTWLGAVAARTRKIGLGTGVTCPILRYHPAIIAQAVATLSNLAPGRVYLGLGTGEALNEYAVTGMWPQYNEREERMHEAIELMRKLWAGEDVTFKGKYYQTHKARLYTPPAQPIPIYISALVPPSALFAGKYGDGLFTVSGKQPEVYRELLKNFEQGAREAGKNSATMPRVIELNVEYEQDLAKALENHLKYWAGSYIPALFDQKIYSPKMAAENGRIVTPEALKKAGCMSAKAEDHRAFARQFIDLGFDHLVFHSARQNQQAFIEAYTRDVIGHLREPAVAAH
ncbi:MAG TPA: TIGR03557 family F420-dependent LLM class oxidoreductase [Ktedonobacteraceae bacterium]|jgi:coenzyme F420-dependent glucose-6-phosphate dehydrogenase